MRETNVCTCGYSEMLPIHSVGCPAYEMKVEPLMTPQDQPNPLKEQHMGQLIAELSKFGGMERDQASKLAGILLPHIKAYFLDLIGGNENVIKPVGSVGVDIAEAAKIRNKLRQELREKLK